MLRTIEAVIDSDGSVRLLEPVSLDRARRALVTIIGEPGNEADVNSSALLSEPVLGDWNQEEVDAAWAHLQQEPQPVSERGR